MKISHFLLWASVLLVASQSWAQTAQVIDIPTRPGITQRFVLLTPEKPVAAVVLFAGGHGGLRISSNGTFGWGGGNFLVRSRERFASQGFVVAVVDAPSDRQNPPYLGGFRQTVEHVADIKAVIAWLRQKTSLPIWLVGTSRGTQSAAYVATELSPSAGGPDGLVLTSTILTDDKGRPVPDLPLKKLSIPVLVVHHKQDGCSHCRFSDISRLMSKLPPPIRKELVALDGGNSRGDPCEPFAYHGFNGLEDEVVRSISAWIKTK